MALARFIAKVFSPLRSGLLLLKTPRAFAPPRSSEKTASHLQLGRRGEKIAARFLRRKHGYKILYRNFRAPHGGEIDIVCRDGDTLVFIEVKTRSRTDFGAPAEAVNRAKQELIARGAFAWLRMLDNPDVLFRFDIVEIVVDRDGGKPQINLIQNAFQLPERFIY